MMGRRPDTVRLDQVSVGSDGTWIQHISESVLLHSTSTRGISTTRLQLQQKSATLQYKPHTSIWTHCLSLAKKYYLSTKTSLKVQGSQKLIHNKLNHTVKLNLPEVTLRKFPSGIICKTIAVVLVSATPVFGNLPLSWNTLNLFSLAPFVLFQSASVSLEGMVYSVCNLGLLRPDATLENFKSFSLCRLRLRKQLKCIKKLTLQRKGF